MGAITVHMQQKTLQHDPARCIGCGLCQVACEQRQAVRMEPVPEYRVPYKSWYSLLLRNAPSMLRTSCAMAQAISAIRRGYGHLDPMEPQIDEPGPQRTN